MVLDDVDSAPQPDEIGVEVVENLQAALEGVSVCGRGTGRPGGRGGVTPSVHVGCGREMISAPAFSLSR
jgi:hypothetical protein